MQKQIQAKSDKNGTQKNKSKQNFITTGYIVG